MSGIAATGTEGTTPAAWNAPEAYTRLVASHGPSLVRLAILLGADRFDAEDAVQDALISVAAAWDRVRPATAHAYLRTAVVHAVMDQHRRRHEVPGDVPERAADDAGLLRFEEDRQFLQLVRGLPEQQRAVVVLRYSVGLRPAEIARILGVEPVTVRTQSSRALARIRRDLGGAS